MAAYGHKLTALDKLTWVRPASDGGAPITGYTITTLPSGVTKTVDADSTSTTLTDLTNGTDYTFTITATNTVGTSPPSTPSNSITPAGPPDAPANPTVTDTADESITLRWDKPDTNGSPITGYTITTSPSGATKAVDAYTTSTTITGLTNGNAYTFTINATNAVGTSPDSGPSTTVSPASHPSAPAKPTATAGDKTALVSWVEPEANGSAITGYTITTSPSGATKTVDAETTSTTVAGLANGTGYDFTIKATNAVGTGAASTPSNPVTPSGLPDAPAKPAAKASDKSASISWVRPDANGSPITSYTITTSPGGATKTVDADATSVKITKLVNGRTYRFTVRAKNFSGLSVSSASVQVIPAGRPATVARPSAKAGKRYATIKWRAPSSNGAYIRSYKVRASNGKTITAKSTSRSYKFKGLKKGKKYTFRVYASNSAGTSSASKSSKSVRIK